MRIGDVALRAGVSAKAIRRYEALGLLAPARLANGYRAFSEQDVRVVRELRALRDLGIPAERSRPFLECLASGAPAADDCPSSMAEYRTAIAELDDRIAELATRRDELTTRLTAAAYRGSCAPAPPAPTPGAPSPQPAAGDAEPAPLDDAPPATAEPVTHGARTPPGCAVPPPTVPATLAVRTSPGHDAAAGIGTDLARRLRGRRLPDLELPVTGGGSVVLRALGGGGPAVLYVYPLTGRPDVDLPAGWDSIPGARGCTAEACGFRDHHQALAEAGATAVHGLSSQDTGYQEEVVRRLRLPFRMLSDPARDLAAALGLPLFEAGGEPLYTRLTMIVTGGVVEELFHPVTEPGAHAGEILRWLRSRA